MPNNKCKRIWEILIQCVYMLMSFYIFSFKYGTYLKQISPIYATQYLNCNYYYNKNIASKYLNCNTSHKL